MLLFQDSQFSTSNNATPIIHSAVTSVTPNLHSKENSNLKKHNLKDKRIEQRNAELKALKSFAMEQLYVIRKLIENFQGQKATPNHSVVTESLKEEHSHLSNENLTKTQTRKTITENQYFASTSVTQSSSNTKETYNTRLNMAHNSTINLTENNKSKRSGSRTRDDNFKAIANSN